MDKADMAVLDDAALAAEAARGSQAAFAEIHGRYAPMVHGILIAKLPYQDCEDAMQEVFTAAFRSIGGLRERGSLGPWLAAIARNRAADYHRARRGRLIPIHDGFEPDGIAGSAPGASSDGAILLRAIQALPEAYRETMALRFVEGFTGPEIATKTGLTHGSVRVNLSRGVEILREMLRGKEGA